MELNATEERLATVPERNFMGVDVACKEMEGIVELGGMRAGSLPFEEREVKEGLLVRELGVKRFPSPIRLVNVLFRVTSGEAVMVWMDEVSDGFRLLVGVMSFFESGVPFAL